MVLTGRTALIALIAVLPIAVAPWPAMAFLMFAVALTIAVATDTALAARPDALVLRRSGPASVRLGESVDTVITIGNDGSRRFRGAVRDAWPPSADA